MLTDDYIAGLFDGEGCVILQTHHDKRGKGYTYLEPYVCITSCDKGLLEEIALYMNSGTIREKDNHRRGHSHCHQLEFKKQADMSNVLKRLYPMLRIKKDAANRVIRFIDDKKERRESARE